MLALWQYILVMVICVFGYCNPAVRETFRARLNSTGGNTGSIRGVNSVPPDIPSLQLGPLLMLKT